MAISCISFIVVVCYLRSYLNGHCFLVFIAITNVTFNLLFLIKLEFYCKTVTLFACCRYDPRGPPAYPSCDHFNKSYKCRKLRMRDIKEFHQNFYSTREKNVQDAFIIKHVKVKSAKRPRNIKRPTSTKKVSTNFYIRVSSTDAFCLRVCQQTFIEVLQISRKRVQSLARKFLTTGTMPIDRRGGARPKPIYERRKAAIKAFIEKLKCCESHYSRGKSIHRRYLPGNLSINKLYRMYNNEQTDESLKSKKTFWQQIFTTQYNIGFGTPTTDACSNCIELKAKIKKEINPPDKNKLMAELTFHKMRYKAFFRKLQEKREDLLTLSFDCQKNMVLPKVQDQTAYYSRQVYMYNFTIVKGSSKDCLTPENVYCYYWMEHEHRKGANEIASAVFHLLSLLDLSSYSKIRLCADGCGGQNRNSIMIGMLSYFLIQVAPRNIEQIEVIFPITGHSFLPADRVFASIEKKLRKLPVIIEPTEYETIYSEHSTVFRMGNDLKVYDWKNLVETYYKKTTSWHFRFNEAKRFILSKSSQQNILVRGETSYNSDLNDGKVVVKKGVKIKSITLPDEIPVGVTLKAAKIDDVKKLLTKHFGELWDTMPECAFYKNVVLGNTVEITAHNRRAKGTEDIGAEDDFCEGHADEQLAERV